MGDITPKDNNAMRSKLMDQVNAGWAASKKPVPSTTTATTPTFNPPVIPTSKKAGAIPSWDQLHNSKEALPIVAKNDDGIENKVGVTDDPNAEKILTGSGVQGTWSAISKAKPGDWYIGTDNAIHIIDDRDIKYSQMMLDKAEEGDASSNSGEGQDTAGANNSGLGYLDKLQNDLSDLNKRKADPSAEYTGIPGENARGDIQGYRSVINDAKDLYYADKDLKAARENDDVRQGALAAKREIKDVSDSIKKYDKEYTQLLNNLDQSNKKTEKMLIKSMINQKKSKLDDLQKKSDEINKDFKKTYGISIDDALRGYDAVESAGINPDDLWSLAGEKSNELVDLITERNKINEELNYISKDIKGDIELLLDPNADPTKLQEAVARLDEVAPQIKDILNNKVNINKNSLDALASVVENLGDDESKELYQNLQGMAQGFIEKKIDPSDPKVLKALSNFSKQADDIVKNQELYDRDTRYASDMKLSAFNRLMFNIFDDIKSAIVFAAAIESGNPQVIRSALDTYNYKLQEAENKRKTDQYGAYTENRIREITQDNLARFKKITEIDPEIGKLEKMLNIQEGEAGKRQMDALEAGFEEFNKYKQNHPGEAIDFAAWVSANRNAGGVLGQVISALLMNFPDLKNAGAALLQGMSSMKSNDTGSDETEKNNIFNVSEGKPKKTASFLDNAVSKSSKSKEPEKKEDPALRMDMQNTVGQALAARQMPPQGQTAPQGQQLNTKTGFGRTA